jgi:RimJ/RimL family protein N-acetyltransferase
MALGAKGWRCQGLGPLGNPCLSPSEDFWMSSSLQVLGQTERVLVRAPQTDDLDEIARLWTDPLVTQHIGGPREPAIVLEHFQEYAQDPEAFVRDEHERWWSVIERSTEELAGLCSLAEKEIEGHVETELGYFFLPRFWGRGLATEAAGLAVRHAFVVLQLDSLIAIVHPDNASSIAVALRLGMHLECKVLRPDGVERQIHRLFRSK